MIPSTGRDLEDQADRVGLRYAFEGGFDVRQGPRLWRRFREKYGEPDKITNFFFGSHSRPTSRIQSLEREIALNYQRGTIEKCKRIDKREVDQVSPPPASRRIVQEETGINRSLAHTSGSGGWFGARWGGA